MKNTINEIVRRHAYSYIRFSSAAQSSGDSFRRQVQRTADFCQRHNLVLNETRFNDLGVSGWTGKNMETGALGDFLHALKAGKLEKNAVLVVENFDRFSRLKPRKAYDKLAEIIEAGIDVVTLEDGKFHSKETLDDFATLISSLAVMQRANEESTRKSILIRAACEQKRKLALAGKGIITGNCPAWLRAKADQSGFEFIPERVQLVKRIIQWVKEGKGKREIARRLDAEKVATWSWAKRWRDNYILELVKSRALVGEVRLQQRKDKTGPVITNYYPAVIDEATWQSSQPKKIKLYNAGPQSDANNLFAGLLFDGYEPDYHMRYFLQNKVKGYIYLKSDYQTVDPLYLKRKELGADGQVIRLRPLSGTSIRYREFEEHFFKHFPEIDLHGTLPARSAAESSRLAALTAEQKENEKALENLVKALEAGQESGVVMRQIEKREATARRLAKELEGEVRQNQREKMAVDSFAEEQQRMKELLEGSTREARLALRAMLHRIIERIDIYQAGLMESIPEKLKAVVYPDRLGLRCYCVTMTGKNRIWIWWDGCQVWE